MKQNKYAEGQRFYEVFIYKIRPCTITGVTKLRGNDCSSYTCAYTVRCDDNSPSPRYYESDFGKVLFPTLEEAQKKLCENIRFRRSMQETQLRGMLRQTERSKRERSAAHSGPPDIMKRLHAVYDMQDDKDSGLCSLPDSLYKSCTGELSDSFEEVVI